jgi:hypothetical protein
MNRPTAIAVSTATLAIAVLSGGVATASGGASSPGGGSASAWSADLPLPTSPGTVISQSSSTASVRSTDTVAVVKSKLDAMYGQMGCTNRPAVNRPKDYFCFNSATGRTVEVYFTFALLDPTATDPSRSQTNAFRVGG